MRVPSLVLSACLALANTSLSAPGDLDTAFAADQFYKGQFDLMVNANEYSMASVALQSDGKIVAAAAFRLIRLMPDGTLDPSFNSTGVISLGPSAFGVGFQDVAIQPDGKIIACARGDSTTDPNRRPSLRRWNPDGTPDTSFNGNGVVLLPSYPSDLALDDSGRILVVMDPYLARYSAIGEIDATFGQSGLVGSASRANAVATFPGGVSILAAGTLRKFDANGREDSSFPEVPTDSFSGSFSTPMNMEVSGSRLIVGRRAGLSCLSIVDYDGLVVGNFGGEAVCGGSTLLGFTMQRDGKVIMVGTTAAGNQYTTIRRVLPSGGLDPAFGTEGVTQVGSGNARSFATRAVVQRDGKIVVGAIRDAALVVMRLLGDDPDLTMEHPKGTNLEAVPVPVIDFGPVVAGQSGTRTIHLSNRTAADLDGLKVVKGMEGTPGEFSVVTAVPETLAAGESVALTVNMTPSSPGQKSATLVIQSNDPDENPFTLSLVGRQATATDLWRQTHFGSMDGTGIAADLSDPDADGIPNLMEFALGANPREPTPAPGTLTRNGITLEFTYWRSKAALGEVAFVREFSQSLADGWSQIGGMVESIIEETTELQKVLVTTPAGTAGRRFVRLRVTRR
jgi:uncharacterized delta-60 repeat protein